MNLEKDLKQLKKEKQLKKSAIAQLRKRSKDSIARPKAEKIFYQLIQGCREYNGKRIKKGS